MFRRRSLTEPVDYLRRGHDRRKLTNYLRTGNFKKIGGSRSVDSQVFARRLVFCAAVAVVIVVGLVYTAV